MVKNFEKWRVEQMSRFASEKYMMHYHLTDDSASGVVCDFLQELLVKHVDSHRAPIYVQLSPSVADYLFQFLDEFRYAYIHPRSTSHRYLFLASLPANRATQKNLGYEVRV